MSHKSIIKIIKYEEKESNTFAGKTLSGDNKPIIDPETQ